MSNALHAPNSSTATWRRRGLRALIFAGAAAATMAVATPAHAAPPGDDFAQAQLIAGFRGSITATNVGATAELGEPSHATTPSGAPDKPDHSIWFRWKSPTTGRVVFRTRDSGIDTVMAAYSGDSLSNIVQLDHNDDTPFTLFNGTRTFTDSQVAFSATKDVEYRIAVDSFTGSLPADQVETGTVKLSWNANDSFTGAQPLPGPTGTAVSGTGGDSTGASVEVGEPQHAGQVGGHSIWYSWRAQKSGTVTFDTAASDIDTLLAAYKGSNVNQLTQIAANDDSTPGQIKTSRITFQAAAGSTYKIAVDGKAGAQGIIVLQYHTS